MVGIDLSKLHILANPAKTDRLYIPFGHDKRRTLMMMRLEITILFGKCNHYCTVLRDWIMEEMD